MPSEKERCRNRMVEFGKAGERWYFDMAGLLDCTEQTHLNKSYLFRGIAFALWQHCALQRLLRPHAVVWKLHRGFQACACEVARSAHTKHWAMQRFLPKRNLFATFAVNAILEGQLLPGMQPEARRGVQTQPMPLLLNAASEVVVPGVGVQHLGGGDLRIFIEHKLVALARPRWKNAGGPTPRRGLHAHHAQHRTMPLETINVAEQLCVVQFGCSEGQPLFGDGHADGSLNGHLQIVHTLRGLHLEWKLRATHLQNS
mmetsp:Transcript_83653/g.270425  ORF Transcript_83653/g.270425 Transcript_83653/m.270425 type:complete len:257 (-) Transcript_83653:86-856(-)